MARGTISSMAPTRGAWSWRAVWLLLNAVSVIVLLWLWWQFSVYHADGSDMRSYYNLNLANLYGNAVLGERGSFLYSPAFAVGVAPFTELSWLAFYGLWTGLAIGALALVLGPLLAVVAVLLLPFVQVDIGYGNINALLALSIVAGMRWPGAWSFVLLTKVTPGIGILWFAVRREWRSLGIALALTFGLVLASIAVVGVGPWVDWLRLLATSTRPTVWDEANLIPLALPLRLVGAAGLVTIGALRGWRWMVPIACFVAMPITWSYGLILLLAIVPLLGEANPVKQRFNVGRRGVGVTEQPDGADRQAGLHRGEYVLHSRPSSE